MHITLKGIGLGEWRFLDEKEMEILNKAIANQTKHLMHQKLKESSFQ